MNSFKLTILAPDRDFFHGQCESLTVPITDGELGILAGHSNMLAAIVPGVLRYREPGKDEETVVCAEGMVRVEGGEVLLLSGALERPEEIDIKRAERAEAAAKEKLRRRESREEMILAQAALTRAATRISASKRGK